MSFIARSIDGACTRVNAISRGSCGASGVVRLRAPANPSRVQESTVPSDPRTSLSAAIAAAASADDLDAALASITSAGVDTLGASLGAIFLADPDRPGLTLAASVGLPTSSTLTEDVQDPAHPFHAAAVGRTSTFDREATLADGTGFVGSYLPLVVSSGGVELSLGAIGFGWPAPHVPGDAERSTLTDLAALAAIAADRHRLASTAAERSEWFERMAHTDPLTGLANERTVARILELELARAGRQGSEVSLAVFDVDDFRATNADAGHDVGDDVLRRVAAVLAESVRLVDTVGRIGGDEFVLVAPGSAGAMVARRVQDGIAALPAVAGLVVSVSAGVATFPADGSDSDALIASAMGALTRAKEAGVGSVIATEPVAEG
jgi:diguanylate cyclase (GGDEF)-like protein